MGENIIRWDGIWVIGTDPPCPRCDYLSRMVQDIVNTEGIPQSVRHISYASDEALYFAKSLGLTPGTAKDVARISGISVDWDAVQESIDDQKKLDGDAAEANCCSVIADRWSPSLDELLRPCELEAPAAGILMTPVLIMNGCLLHSGSVPTYDQAKSWLRKMAANSGHPEKGKHKVEVLGSGCPKCQMLYDNTLIALHRMGLEEDIALVKRTDILYFHQLGVNVIPGLAINGKVVAKGQVLNPDQICELLNEKTAAKFIKDR
ncbi:MAG: thioredoxin family protein [Desulfatitalea sp.]|nr:thioredoxin family protein [Desulfatitalea sp.]